MPRDEKNIKGKEKNIQMAIIHRSVSVTNLRLYNRVRVKNVCMRARARACVCVCGVFASVKRKRVKEN